MYLVASLRPSVRPSVRLRTHSRLNRWTYDLDIWYRSHYQSKVCLCVYNQSAYADNCADAVDRLLIMNVIVLQSSFHKKSNKAFGKEESGVKL